MSSEPTIEPLTGRGPTRGWCPGVLDPMETGDGWLLRIRVPGGVVHPASLDMVAAIAGEFGSGIVDITSRANLQIRGVSADRIERATSAVVDAGLASADARSDAFRSVVSNPLTGHDPAAICDAGPVVEEVVARLVAGVVGAAPSKFGVVIDDGGGWPLGDIDADISILAGLGGTWSVRLRGVVDPIGVTTDPVSVVQAATQLCVDHEARMDRVITRFGISGVIGRLDVTASGEQAHERPSPAMPARMVGVLPHLGEERVNDVAAPFLGRVEADVLSAVAALASRHGVALRLTPDHSFAFCGVRSEETPALLADLRAFGLVVDRDDPRVSISACVGSLGCSWAHADTWAAGHQLSTTAHTPGRVHLSACAKQCGAPAHVRHLVADATGTFR